MCMRKFPKQKHSPTEQVWTAQAETSSVMSGLRYSQLQKWKVSKLDVKGAFMYAPLPEDLLVVVRPPQIWVQLGVIPADTLWTLRRAVYGLRCAPRAWGLYRDEKLRAVTWKSKGVDYRLVQCKTDAQVWMLKQVGDDRTLGLMLVYVDDFMLLSPDGDMRASFTAELERIWKMSTMVELTVDNPVTFLGLEIESEQSTQDMVIHQSTFTRQILTKHGIDRTSKPITAIQMGQPESTDQPPTPQQLKELQAFAGEFNWLATRTRSDLAYFTSVIASTATKYADWTLQLCKKVLRYLVGTVNAGIRFPLHGDPSQMIVWSDAGYGGLGTTSQTGILISWADATTTWRSSRQATAALSTCEAEVSAGAMAFQVAEGLKYLLEEWGVVFKPTILLIDNKSALLLGENGGTWRTRYFAVRAARLQEEHQSGNLILRYCPTASMAADAMTKMGTSQILDNLREAMNCNLPAVPSDSMTVKVSDDSWWAAGVIAHNFRRERQNEHYWRKLNVTGRSVLADGWMYAKALYTMAMSISSTPMRESEANPGSGSSSSSALVVAGAAFTMAAVASTSGTTPPTKLKERQNNQANNTLLARAAPPTTTPTTQHPTTTKPTWRPTYYHSTNPTPTPTPTPKPSSRFKMNPNAKELIPGSASSSSGTNRPTLPTPNPGQPGPQYAARKGGNYNNDTEGDQQPKKRKRNRLTGNRRRAIKQKRLEDELETAHIQQQVEELFRDIQ